MARATSAPKPGDGARPTDDPTLPAMPADIDGPRTKLVYLGVHAAGEATLDELQTRLDEPRLSLYPVLADLRRRGLVVADGETYRPT